MQSASTNICKRMGHSQELSEFKHGTVIGCHLCYKFFREIYSLPNIPQSTVSGIITKCKQLGTTATQQRGKRILRHRSHQFSAINSYRPPNFTWPSDELKNSA